MKTDVPINSLIAMSTDRINDQANSSLDSYDRVPDQRTSL